MFGITDGNGKIINWLVVSTPLKNMKINGKDWKIKNV